MPQFRHVLLLACAVALSACGGDKSRAPGSTSEDGTEALPAPAGARGSVTGMPDEPGPGQVGPPKPEDAVALDAEGNPVLPTDDPLAGTTAPVDPNAPPVLPTDIATNEPSVEDAVAVIRDYYAAINRRDFAQAYALWSDGGRSSNQTPEQFAAGFADTTGVSVEIMAPGRVDAAAGSRYVEVPVALTATHADGRQQRFVGAYTLRRAVVDGASAEQRAWRIGTADLREVSP
ncbi:hypothetical protein [Lysobacter auxotrophicus]|uniref:DUF4829 domain-containing protein n=1 Tax=Lysobacter auxotrophicus TaxID=2992573 RepID=A0ABM8DGA3_9GAMM|nr:hypothetical protein [Lysobacter auxotrophicus]BDU17638.1 DUF4829 domain-containing protein [Lysobacter auxotrophicus]